MKISITKDDCETVTDKYNKAKEMCLFWTPDKGRGTSKATPRREVQREKRERQAKSNVVQ